eukprot:NODE_8_length_66115_cov_0.981823.p41 type:complete len:182 gc:universal NODE_8_length_66115_cov_0.981823:38342-37797(-)
MVNAAELKQAIEFLSEKNDIRDQVRFLEEKGLTPQEIYYALLKAGIYVPLKYNYFVSLLLGGGIIYAGYALFQYTLNQIVKPIQQSIDEHIGQANNQIGQMQKELEEMSNDVDNVISTINNNIIENNKNINDMTIEFQKLEESVTRNATEQDKIVKELISDINQLKDMLSKNKNPENANLE